MNTKQFVSVALIVVLIVNMILLALSMIKPLYFWIILVLIFVFAKLVILKKKRK